MNGLQQLVMMVALAVSALPADRAANAAQIPGDARKLQIVNSMYEAYRKDFPSVRDIEPMEAMRLFRKGKAVFIDVRPQNERSVSVLPKAVNTDDFLKNIDLYKDKTAIAYCTISFRSGVFARKMAERGVDILNLRGGLLGWVLVGGPVFGPDGKRTRRIHVYGEKWDYPPAGYTSVW